MEMLHVERLSDDEIEIVHTLRDKSPREYLRGNETLEPGQVRLSEINCVIEDGVKRLDFPTIRAVTGISEAGTTERTTGALRIGPLWSTPLPALREVTS